MEQQRQLDDHARQLGLTLTPLGKLNTLSCSVKVAACGGMITRVETESSSDSTVCLQDSSGTCLCALHGELTSRYPDSLATGTVLIFADITVLVTSTKMPPLLIACLMNLKSLLLLEGDLPLPPPCNPNQRTRVDLASCRTPEHTCLRGNGPETVVWPSLQQPLRPLMEAIPEETVVTDCSYRVNRSASIVRDPHPPQSTGEQPFSTETNCAPWISDDEDCLELADDF